MQRYNYTNILQDTLLPFLNKIYPEHHWFMQYNDPKHTSAEARRFFDKNKFTWWETPPESPDFNPIENMWHEMKEFIRKEVR